MARWPVYSEIVATLPPELRALAKDYFAYRIEFLPLGANQALTGSFNVQSDSDFVIVARTALILNAATGAWLDPNQAPFLITETDTGSGRQIMDGAVGFAGFFGTGSEPHYLVWPKKIRAASAYTVRLENLSATAFNVRLAFHGFKLFPFTER
jgi:hypothetical protein